MTQPKGEIVAIDAVKKNKAAEMAAGACLLTRDNDQFADLLRRSVATRQREQRGSWSGASLSMRAGPW